MSLGTAGCGPQRLDLTYSFTLSALCSVSCCQARGCHSWSSSSCSGAQGGLEDRRDTAGMVEWKAGGIGDILDVTPILDHRPPDIFM